MGIKDLNAFLKKACPNVFIARPLTDFRGKRIAIDSNNFLFARMSTAHTRIVNKTDVAIEDPDPGAITQTFCQLVLESVTEWLSYGITPVFVFDGKYPEKKDGTKEKRRAEREGRLKELNTIRDQVRAMDILSKNQDMIEKLRAKMRMYFYLSSDNIALIRGILEGIGIPCFRAEGEAEQLCSMFCIEGYVAAVMSTDTDNLVYGCPMVIKRGDGQKTYDPDLRMPVEQVESVSIRDVLSSLKFTFEMFVDLCIIMGCDYNIHVDYLGGAGAFKLIEKYKSIDNIPRLPENPNHIDHRKCACGLRKEYKDDDGNKHERVYDISSLDHVTCRGMFRRQAVDDLWDREDLIESKLEDRLVINNMLAQTGRDILTQYNLIDFLPKLLSLYRTLPTPSKTEERTPEVRRFVIRKKTASVISAEITGIADV